MLKQTSLFIFILSLTACSKTKVENATSDFLPGKRLGRTSGDKLKELSGLAASTINPGLLWTHNDSGNTNEIFLIDEELTIKMTCVLKGIRNRDWEDMAIGPGPEENKHYIYLGDIGDNEATHKLKYIYRFEEPEFNAGKETITIEKTDVITFKLPDKKRDTETLLLDPKTKNLYIVSKREKEVHVYELAFPHSTTDTLIATPFTTLPVQQIVAGDFSADGKKLLMKNYEHVYYWKNDDNQSLVELLKKKPFEVPYKVEPQGEAIAWAHDGSGFYTISEKNFGKDVYLYYYKKKK